LGKDLPGVVDSSLTGLAGKLNLTRVDVNAGSVVIKEDDPGDRYYAIANGQLEAS
jgi:hypothetical protein